MMKQNRHFTLKGDAPPNSSSVIFQLQYGQIQPTSYFHKIYKKLILKFYKMEHSETPNIVFFKTTALLRYLTLPAYLLSQNLQRHNIFSFLKINDKNPKGLAHFYLFLIIVRHPKVVTLVYSPLRKSLTL